jgi:hypothetical protein
MTDILSPPSPLASYGSNAPTKYSERYHPSAGVYGSSHTSYSREAPKALSVARPDNTHFGNQYKVPSTYDTPPQTVVLKSSMIQGHRGGPVVAGGPQTLPQVAAAQSHQPPPQLPVPQPRVTYQPVSTIQVEQVALKDEHNGAETGAIASYMQIPASINSSKGSLSEFASQITCLFWFESIDNLMRVEESASIPAPLTPLADDAKPTIGFRKWVTTMLSTTQVTQNVILLALMFIYRLKTQNPQVRGKAGSEYRLLTVALMLGNKFLDDNTYTNKTWADVSGISVAEIHVMEVEFLSNMRYALYTSLEDWTLWHQKLARFYDYFEKASRSPKPLARPPPLMGLSPVSMSSGATTVPSPPNHMLPYGSLSRHTSPPYSQQGTPLPRPPQLPPQLPQPVHQLPQPNIRPVSRKRAYDEEEDDEPAKRFRSALGNTNGHAHDYHSRTSSVSTSSYPESQMTRLPMPNFNQQPSSQAISNPLHTVAHLPPPQARSMAMVYGTTTQAPPPSQLTVPHNMAASGSRISIPSIFDHSQGGQSLQLHPISTSPPSSSGLTPTSHELLSPSVFPINRSSPYRPVRSVNTLLVPPPTASVQNAPQAIGTTNMHYQPIGKPPTERRTGVVPYMHQSHPQDRSSWFYAPPPQYPAPR